MPMAKKLKNRPVGGPGAPATAATAAAAEASSATAVAAEASSLEWHVQTLAGECVLALECSLTICGCAKHLHNEVARILMHGNHSLQHLSLRHKDLDVREMPDQQLRSINSISMIKLTPPTRWWFMRETNTLAGVFGGGKSPTLTTMPNDRGRPLLWTGSLNIVSTCQSLLF